MGRQGLVGPGVLGQGAYRDTSGGVGRGEGMNETTITVSGNLVSDVELRHTARGDALARFRVASTASRYDRASGRWLDGDTSFWNVTVWRRAAENAHASLAKGQPVVLFGRIKQRTVDRAVPTAPGSTMAVTFTDIEATHFGLDLSRCRARYERAPIGPQTSELGSLEGPGPGSDAPPGGQVEDPSSDAARAAVPPQGDAVDAA
jgi:single-strand DNA-binding protein